MPVKDQDYEKVAQQLQQNLTTGLWPEGAKIPSERQLSSEFHTSRNKIRRAIAQLIADGYLRTVPGSGTYVAELPRKQRAATKNIAFLICTRGKPHYTVTSNLFFAEVLRGVEYETRRRNYHCIVSIIDEENRNYNELQSIINKVDGAVVCELRSEPLLSFLEQNLPTALISPSVSSRLLDSIAMDNAQGVMQAVTHLYERGCRRIAYLSGSRGSYPAQQRLQGYYEALDQLRIPRRDELVRICGWNFDQAKACTEELLQDQTFDGIVAASDILAFAAIQVCSEHKLTIPDRVKITGFDNLETAEQSQPPLTTICVNKEFMGRQAVKLLVDRFQEQRDFGLHMVIPTDLIVREST